MVTEQYVSFETAKLLNKHGFDINTDTSYVVDNTNRPAVKVGDFLHNMPRNEKHLIAAPTQALAMRWLLETHDLYIEIHRFKSWFYTIIDMVDDKTLFSEYCGTYDECIDNGLKYCLENLI